MQGFLVFIIIVPTILWMSGCFDKKRCVEVKTISSAGGCDKYGNCGVGFTDGTFGNEKFPVIGQKICTKSEVIK